MVLRKNGSVLMVLGLLAAVPGVSPADVAQPADGGNVLVLANRGWRGEDGTEAGESERVARYYMKRRNVPERNLLVVDIEEEEPSYPVFYDEVILPLAGKLKELRGDTVEDPILYILCCYGMPIRVDPGHAVQVAGQPAEWEKTRYNPDGSIKTRKRYTYNNKRAADSFLCYPHLLARLSRQEAPGSARKNFMGVFDKYDFAPPVVHPYYGLSVQASDPKPDPGLRIGLSSSRQKIAPQTFMEARRRDPNAFAYYLVCRLDAPTPLIARSLVDKAIYAERYLQNPGANANASYRTRCVFDIGEQKKTGRQVRDAIDWFGGKTPGSPFADTPWPTIVDTGTKPGEEIGIPGKDGRLYRPNDPAFTDLEFPVKDVAWYYGHYTTYGRYQDVYQWAVGAVGVHMDSGSCAELHTTVFDTFADNPKPPDDRRPGFVPHALVRNMTATSGTVHEPFENGIIAANFLFRALSLGMNFADACYSAIEDVWWKSVFIGDPLYRPFGTTKAQDEEPPRILSAKVEIRGEDVTIRAGTDKPCQFRVTDSKGKVLRPYSAWGDSWDTRDWFFSCEHVCVLRLPGEETKGLRLSVRSPAGRQSQRELTLRGRDTSALRARLKGLVSVGERVPVIPVRRLPAVELLVREIQEGPPVLRAVIVSPLPVPDPDL
ncbi:MAG: hypothetical protein HQ559_01000 [Lentisphaerae bacterium]|nr:hypothetical protein [Lentisphaerota bacterium]